MVAEAGPWATRKLSPGGYVSYSWTVADDDSDTPHLDTRRCNALVVSWDPEPSTSPGTATANVDMVLCNGSQDAIGICHTVDTFTAEDLGTRYPVRPGFIHLNASAAIAASENPTFRIFCEKPL
jgi:hypothetical protein